MTEIHLNLNNFSDSGLFLNITVMIMYGRKDKAIHLFDEDKKIVIITDCDRRYPSIFKRIWGKNVS